MPKNILNAVKVVDAGDMSADVTSDPIDVRYLDNIAIQCNFTGTPTGPFYVQGSVDKSNWASLTLSGSPAAAGSDDTVLIDVNQVSVPWLRVFYDRTSGTGSLDVWVAAKGI